MFLIYLTLRLRNIYYVTEREQGLGLGRILWHGPNNGTRTLNLESGTPWTSMGRMHWNIQQENCKVDF